MKSISLEELRGEMEKQYPNMISILDRTADGEPVLDIYTEETNVYIRKRKNGKFQLNGVWPSDEKGKRNLTANQMVKAIGTIPGVL